MTARLSLKLTPEQVIEIAHEYRTTDVTQTALGQRYGVSHSTIHRVVSGFYDQPTTLKGPTNDHYQP